LIAVVIEAQACGTCVIGSSNGGIPEAIGFDEYVVEEGEDFEEEFAKKVVDVLQKGYDAQELIERAQPVHLGKCCEDGGGSLRSCYYRKREKGDRYMSIRKYFKSFLSL